MEKKSTPLAEIEFPVKALGGVGNIQMKYDISSPVVALYNSKSVSYFISSSHRFFFSSIP